MRRARLSFNSDVMNLSYKIENLRNYCIGRGKCSKVCPSLKHGGVDPMEVMMGGETNMAFCICCGCCSEVCRRSYPATVMKDIAVMERDIHLSGTFRDTGYVMPPAEPVPEPVLTDGGVRIVPGCVAKDRVPYVIYATSITMQAMGMGALELEGNTCGLCPV